MKKIFLPHVAMMVFNTPLMILPEKLEVIQQVLGPRIGLGGVEIDETVQSEVAKKLAVKKAPASAGRTDIAVIPVVGSLVYRSTGFDSMSGLRSYKSIQDDLQAALDDPKVGAILFDISSPGGVVEGAFALADKIHEAGNKKPTYSYINEHGYSAAYLIASQTQNIFLPKTGGVGSIGVRMAHVDMSKWDENNGIKVTNLYAGARKVDFDPHSPLSKDAYDSAMKEINELYDFFVEAVAKGRGMDTADVRKTEAGLFQGKNAVKAGLADKVMTFDEAIDLIAKDITGRKIKTNNLNKEVKGIMYGSIAEMKADNLALYTQLLEEAKVQVTPDVQRSFDVERKDLNAKIENLTAQNKEKDEKIKQMEKAEFIRTQKEAKATRDAAADKIWIKALASSDVPEHMHEKVRKMVETDKFVKEDALDEAAFEAAVKAEIADWEDKGMKTSIIGTGMSSIKKDPVVTEDSEADDAEVDSWVDEMLDLAGQKKEVK